MKKILNIISKFIDLLSDSGMVISAALIILMSFSIVYEVVLRIFFSTGTTWVTEGCTLAMVGVCFFGSGYVQKKRANINMDIITANLPPQLSKFMIAFVYLLTVAFMGLFCSSSYNLLYNAITLHQISNSAIQIPLWLPYGAMFIGAAILVLQFAKDTIVAAVGFFTYKPQPDDAKAGLLDWVKIAIVFSLVIAGYFVFQMGGNWRALGFIMILFGFLFSGMPVFSVLLSVGVAGFMMMRGFDVGMAQLGTLTYGGVKSFTLCALPLFIFAGGLFAASGMIGKLFNFCEGLLHFLPNNLAVATIITCAIFAALSGSSVATAATVGLIAVPEMIRRGYDPRLACGSVTAAGTLGSMIPPSNQFIIYSVLTDTSVGQLFMGGILPGVMMATLFIVYIIIRGTTKKEMQKASKASNKFKGQCGKLFVSSLPVLAGPVVILGGIYAGFFTPTESAAIAVFYGLFLCLLAKKFNRETVLDVIKKSAQTSVVILLIVGAATTFGGSITLMQIAQKFSNFVVAAGMSKWAVFACIAVLTLILGCLMDGIALTMIVVPITFTAMVNLGFSPVWFGIVFCLLMEMGLVTPPVGMTLYTVKGIVPNVGLGVIIKGSLPFLFIMILSLLILCAVPKIALLLPSLMF